VADQHALRIDRSRTFNVVIIDLTIPDGGLTLVRPLRDDDRSAGH
jgi:hypothetical protein